MKTITVRLNEEELRVFNAYAGLHDIDLSTLLKKTLKEKMENEFDMSAIVEYEGNRAEETYTHDEMKNLLGL